MRIITSLIIGFLVMVLLMGAIGSVAFISYRDVGRQIDMLEKTIVPGVIIMTHLDTAMNNLRRELIDFILSAELEKEQLIASTEVLRRALRELERAEEEHLEYSRGMSLAAREQAEAINSEVIRISNVVKRFIDLGLRGVSAEEILKARKEELVPAATALVSKIREHEAEHLLELKEVEELLNRSQHFGSYFILTVALLSLLLAFVVVFFTVKTIRRMTREVQDSEKRLHMILDCIMDYIAMIDRDLNIVWANQASKRDFGEDIVGRKCYDVYKIKEDLNNKEFVCVGRKAFQNNEFCESEGEILCEDGQARYFNCRADVALRGINGRPEAVLEIFKDITQEKKSRDALEEKVDELERFNKLVINRELKMKELKERIKELEQKLK